MQVEAFGGRFPHQTRLCLLRTLSKGVHHRGGIAVRIVKGPGIRGPSMHSEGAVRPQRRRGGFVHRRPPAHPVSKPLVKPGHARRLAGRCHRLTERAKVSQDRTHVRVTLSRGRQSQRESPRRGHAASVQMQQDSNRFTVQPVFWRDAVGADVTIEQGKGAFWIVLQPQPCEVPEEPAAGHRTVPRGRGAHGLAGLCAFDQPDVPSGDGIDQKTPNHPF